MKKIYSTPMCEVVVCEVTNMLANSVLPETGTSPQDLMPGEGSFDGEFSSNTESYSDIW